MAEVLKDFPPGPLDTYRKKATFDWKKLKIVFNGEDGVKAEAKLIEELKTLPDFQENLSTLTLDEERRIVSRQYNLYRTLEIFDNANKSSGEREAIGTIRSLLSPAASVKVGLANGMPIDVLQTVGTERHRPLIEDIKKGNIQGAFCLTEIGHGSNTKGMQTMATYDKTTKEFVLHTPTFEAAKCWAGNLGQRATFGIVYAQLYTENKNYGLHTFFVPIRDPKTLIPHPGVTLADMGPKLGLNGIDNGVLMFDHYRIPRDYLLNRTGDVDENGQYVTPIKNERERSGIALGALSGGRVGITGSCALYGSAALTIAIRYAAVRKQFGPTPNEEISILEYQTHQIRLFPYLASVYTIKIFSKYFFGLYDKYTKDLSKTGSDSAYLSQLGAEIHAVSSASKPFSSWTNRDGIQECREACGGHGYLKVAGIGNLRNDHDPNLTFEGENHVLIQQTGNWLVKFWPSILNGKVISTPMGSANFLTNALNILENIRFSATNVNEIINAKNIFDTYQWLVCYLLKSTNERYQTLVKNGVDKFKARNDSQAFFAKKLALAYVQHLMLQKFQEYIQKQTDPNIRNVLSKLFSLFAMCNLEKFLPLLYQGGFAQGASLSSLTYEAIMFLCDSIKNDAVALIDAIAPHDLILKSVLGASDGQVYRHLKSAIFSAPYAQSRPTWWKEIVNSKNYATSKL